jgi:hypothetical protein
MADEKLRLVPREMFLTRGVGHHREKLASFEEAVRDAEIASFNLVNVSSIFPPGCKVISRSRGLSRLESHRDQRVPPAHRRLGGPGHPERPVDVRVSLGARKPRAE